MDSLKPLLLTSLKSYSRSQFFKDVTAEIIVAITALPLSIALVLASGVDPEAGIFTAIVAGFVISALGRSSVQIVGATAAFATIGAGIQTPLQTMFIARKGYNQQILNQTFGRKLIFSVLFMKRRMSNAWNITLHSLVRIDTSINLVLLISPIFLFGYFPASSDISFPSKLEQRIYTPPSEGAIHHSGRLFLAVLKPSPQNRFYRVSSLTSLFCDTIINLINEGRISL